MPDLTRGAPPPVLYLPRPSTWLVWHDYLFRPGQRVIDLACGEGRHALKAAQWGASVVGLDADESKLEIGREAATRLGVSVDFRCLDLIDSWPELGTFDAVYDRAALVALQQPERRRYVDLCRSLLHDDGVTLLITFAYDQSKAPGPPWSVDAAMVRDLYGPSPPWKIEVLETRSVPTSERLREAGLPEFEESFYVITPITPRESAPITAK